MGNLTSSSWHGYALATAAFTATVLLLWPQVARSAGATDGFEPHGYCFLWEPTLTRIYVAADSLIGLAYVAISSTLAYLVYRAQGAIPFHWVLLAFGTFILACGGTHFMVASSRWSVASATLPRKSRPRQIFARHRLASSASWILPRMRSS